MKKNRSSVTRESKGHKGPTKEVTETLLEPSVWKTRHGRTSAPVNSLQTEILKTIRGLAIAKNTNSHSIKINNIKHLVEWKLWYETSEKGTSNGGTYLRQVTTGFHKQRLLLV